jgi:hypothetical protein
VINKKIGIFCPRKSKILIRLIQSRLVRILRTKVSFISFLRILGNLTQGIHGDEEGKKAKNSGVYQSLAIDSSGRTGKTDDSPTNARQK